MDASTSNALRIDLIAKQPVFCLLTPEDTQELAALTEEVAFAKDAVIVTEGDFVDCFYIIVSGTAQVTKKIINIESTEIIPITTLSAEQSIGLTDAGFFSQSGLRSADVTAVTDMRLLRIELYMFYRFLSKPDRIYPKLKHTTESYLLMQFIKQIDQFNHLSNNQLPHLAKTVEKVTLTKNQMIFAKGAPADKCYMILTGEVALDDTCLHYPDIFGKETFTASAIYLSDAKTITTVELLVLNKPQLIEFIEHNKATNTGAGLNKLIDFFMRLFKKG